MSDLASRRARIAAAVEWNDAVVLIAAGEPAPIPGGADQTYPFLAHADYYQLAGLDLPGAVLAYDPREGPTSGWVSFVPPVTEAERVWEGRQPVPGVPLPELAGWLAARRGRPVVNLGAPLAGVRGEAPPAVREAFLHARRPKDDAEVALIRRAAAATVAGFAAGHAALRPGVTERALQVEVETGFFRHGATRTGYGTIVAAGTNAAVLHFAPGARPVAPGDFVLVDAGAEVDRYCSDVTRTWVAGRGTGRQRDLYQLVLAVEERTIARCTVGAEWRDLHLHAARDLTEGLVDLGLMRGQADDLVEREAHLLFFPHGIGHMVGLGVRDAGGMLPGRAKSTRPALRNLRTDLPLAPGYVMTVEPGLYFIPALLDDPVRRERHRDDVAWDRLDDWRGLGGVRIEDNVLVTATGPEVLTADIPKGWDAIQTGPPA